MFKEKKSFISKFVKISRKGKIIYSILSLLAFLVVFLNSRYLVEDPRVSEITWDEPSYCAMSEDGTLALIDSYGTRITIISDNGKVIGRIGNNSITGSHVSMVTSLALSEDSLYVLDHNLSDNGSTIISDIISVYSFDGSFKAQIYESDEDQIFQISNIYYKDGTVYAAGFENEEKTFAVIAEVQNGYAESHRFSSFGQDIFSITYNPETDTACAVTHNGNLLVWNGDNYKEISASNTDLQLLTAVSADNCSIYAVDSVKDELISFNGNDNYTVVWPSYAKAITEYGDTLILADYISNSVIKLSISDHSFESITSAEYELSFRATALFTFVCLLFAACFIINRLLKLMIKAVRNIQKKKDIWDTADGKESEMITIGKIMHSIAPQFAVCFAIAAFLFSVFYWKNETDCCKSKILNLSVSTMYLSSDTIGDSLNNINSQKDYDSDDYKKVVSVFDSMCSKVTDEIGFDYGYSIYKYIDNSDDIIVVRDKFSEGRIGTLITSEEQESYYIKDTNDKVRSGLVDLSVYDYLNGENLLCISFPIYDSSDKIVGCGEFSVNYSMVKLSIIEKILTVLVELLTMMAGAMFLVAEIIIAKQMCALQNQKISEGSTENTLVESKHILKVISQTNRVLAFTYTTLIAKDILSNSDLDSAVLLAIPATAIAISTGIARIILAALPIKNPKVPLTFGVILQILGSLICISAVQFNSFISLVVGVSVLGLGVGICLEGCGSISKLGKKCTDKYDNLEYFTLSAAPIAAALGAIAIKYIGNTSVYVLIILISILFFAAQSFFIGSSSGNEILSMKFDINSFSRDNLLFMLKPKVIIWFIFLLCPIALYPSLKSYVLPVLTVSMNLSTFYIATLTVVSSCIALYFIPLTKEGGGILRSPKPNISLATDFAFLAAGFLIFAAVNTFQAYTIIIIMLSVFSESLEGCSKILLDREKVASGLKNVNTGFIRRFCKETVSYFGPIVMSLLMIKDTVAIGIVFGVLSIFSVLVSLFIFHDNTSPQSTSV